MNTPCATEDPDLWFSDTEEDKTTAKNLCGICPLKDKCFVLALEGNEEFGIWGGVDFTRTRNHHAKVGRSKEYKLEQTCRSGLHPKSSKGRCQECIKISRKNYDASRPRKKRPSHIPRGARKTNFIGGYCKNGHLLAKDNTTQLTNGNQALLCNTCKKGFVNDSGTKYR